jgi:hypothetical protein
MVPAVQEAAGSTRERTGVRVAVLERLDEVHADADEAALAARARLEELKVLVDGHRVQDVVHEDACAGYTFNLYYYFLHLAFFLLKMFLFYFLFKFFKGVFLGAFRGRVGVRTPQTHTLLYPLLPCTAGSQSRRAPQYATRSATIALQCSAWQTGLRQWRVRAEAANTECLHGGAGSAQAHRMPR